MDSASTDRIAPIAWVVVPKWVFTSPNLTAEQVRLFGRIAIDGIVPDDADPDDLAALEASGAFIE